MKKETGHLKSDSKLYAFLATFLSIVGFIIVLIAKKDDKYAMYYAKQGLIVFIVSLIASAIGWAFLFSPLGWAIGRILNTLVFILWLLSWIYALSGKEKEVPIVGQLARKLDF